MTTKSEGQQRRDRAATSPTRQLCEKPIRQPAGAQGASL